MLERQITSAPHGHVLTNANVWSPDGKWIVYDVRSDPAGSVFDGTRIEAVQVETGDIKLLYASKNGACCGVASYSPAADKIAFIHGPEFPTADWSYNAFHREGVIVDAANPGIAVNLDARDVIDPFTPGALRGGTHVHTFSGDGQWLSFTYEDHVLAMRGPGEVAAAAGEVNQRNVGVSAPVRQVLMKHDHPRNHSGSHFSVLVTRTHREPRPGSDEIQRAVEDAWVGTNGYEKADGTRQRRSLAFQGEVITAGGQPIWEVFVVDIPDDVTQAGDGPLQGTATTRPQPPKGTQQRRLTRTAGRRFPGIQGPRHWLRSSPDGSRIAFLMKDDEGIVQLWTISPRGGEMRQITHSPWGISSAFTWSPDGSAVACVMDQSVFVIDMESGECSRLIPRAEEANGPRPEACVFSPDGRRIAYARTVGQADQRWNQIFVMELPST